MFRIRHIGDSWIWIDEADELGYFDDFPFLPEPPLELPVTPPAPAIIIPEPEQKAAA